MTESTNEVAFEVRPVGWVSSPRHEAIDDDWGGIESTITLTEAFGGDALLGLDGFSHVEVVFVFDRVEPGSVSTGARVPRGNPAWPAVGIFAQRAKNRPNRLGLCTCEVVGVTGRELRVRGLDAIDGTPVLDLKPFLREFAPRSAVVQPPWSHDLMADYF